jgi:hypothetical protein
VRKKQKSNVVKKGFRFDIDTTRKVKVEVEGIEPFEIEIRIPSAAELASLTARGNPTPDSLLDFMAAHLVSWSLPIPADRESLDKRITDLTLYGHLANLMTDEDPGIEIEKNSSAG